LLAKAAAHRGDRERYRKAAMTVGGYASQGYRGASKVVFLELADAASAAGQPDAALESARQAGVHGPEQDDVALAIVGKLIELDRVPAAKEVVERMQDEIAAVRGLYAVAEASAASARPSALFAECDKLSTNPERAAMLSGIAAAFSKP